MCWVLFDPYLGCQLVTAHCSVVVACLRIEVVHRAAHTFVALR
jgi:hypothetical protein